MQGAICHSGCSSFAQDARLLHDTDQTEFASSEPPFQQRRFPGQCVRREIEELADARRAAQILMGQKPKIEGEILGQQGDAHKIGFQIGNAAGQRCKSETRLCGGQRGRHGVGAQSWPDLRQEAREAVDKCRFTIPRATSHKPLKSLNA